MIPNENYHLYTSTIKIKMMKKLFFLLTLIISMTSAFAQNCELPQNLQDSYDRDVNHLTLVRMEALNSPALSFIQIPQLWQDTIWEGLAAIYNSETPYRDIVFDEYCIHHNLGSGPQPSDNLRVVYGLWVKPDPTAPWAQNWLDGNILTGDNYIDSLFQMYGFNYVNYYSFIDLYIFQTDQILNMNAFGDSLALSNSIDNAFADSYLGGSDKIKYEYLDGSRKYDFQIGWGDCPSGCIYRYTWSFVVDEDCNVTFAGESGDTVNFPSPTNCNLTTNTTNEDLQEKLSIKIFPNPVRDILSLKSQDGNAKILEYSIVDILGNEFLRGHFQDEGTINISSLDKGVYIISIEDEKKKRMNYKLIKN